MATDEVVVVSETTTTPFHSWISRRRVSHGLVVRTFRHFLVVVGKERPLRLGLAEYIGDVTFILVVFSCSCVYLLFFCLVFGGPEFLTYCSRKVPPFPARTIYLRCDAGVALVPLLYFAFGHPPMDEHFPCTKRSLSERPRGGLTLAFG